MVRLKLNIKNYETFPPTQETSVHILCIIIYLFCNTNT